MEQAGLERAVAIVTGAAGGIGGAVVAQLRAAGAKVVAEDIDPAVEQLADDATATVCGDAARADGAELGDDLAADTAGGAGDDGHGAVEGLVVAAPGHLRARLSHDRHTMSVLALRRPRTPLVSGRRRHG